MEDKEQKIKRIITIQITRLLVYHEEYGLSSYKKDCLQSKKRRMSEFLEFLNNFRLSILSTETGTKIT